MPLLSQARAALVPETLSHANLAKAAIQGRCPKCGARTLFEAPAMVAETCSACGLELGELEPSGRFLPLLLTVWVVAILICAAFLLENSVRPPFWVHAALWMPLTLGLELFVLRFFKTSGVHRAYEKRRTAYIQREPR